eukprot:6183471-Pleurochrysis_carterae.AAC.4
MHACFSTKCAVDSVSGRKSWGKHRGATSRIWPFNLLDAQSGSHGDKPAARAAVVAVAGVASARVRSKVSRWMNQKQRIQHTDE